jgi:hypothetical protein
LVTVCRIFYWILLVSSRHSAFRKPVFLYLCDQPCCWGFSRICIKDFTNTWNIRSKALLNVFV